MDSPERTQEIQECIEIFRQAFQDRRSLYIINGPALYSPQPSEASCCSVYRVRTAH